MESELVIKGATIVDFQGSRRSDILIKGSFIVAVEPNIEPSSSARVLDASGCILTPGLVDLHTHTRQPGNEDAETIASAARAAALGGYTAIMAMPNTIPAIDSAPMVKYVLELSQDVCCEVKVAGAITKGRKGEQLSPMAEMADCGVSLFSDDGSGVQDDNLMRMAFEYASSLGVGIAQHCENLSLSNGGSMNEGEISSLLGLDGIPSESEELMIIRDLSLAKLTKAKLHLMHLSSAGSVSLVAQAKTQGVDLTAEVTPHHLSLTEEKVCSFDPIFKVNPPLRTTSDRSGLRLGLASSTIDIVATDHAPHPSEKKELPFDQAPPGMLGLQSALSVVLSDLYAQDSEIKMPLEAILAAMSWKPAKIGGFTKTQGRPVGVGEIANLAVIDLSEKWQLDKKLLVSNSYNTPFLDKPLTGRVRHTIFKGEPVVIDAQVCR